MAGSPKICRRPEKDTRLSKSSLMQKRHLSGLLIVAILLISTALLYAQNQEPNMAKLKADAQKVVSNISRDKVKMRAYCEITRTYLKIAGECGSAINVE